MVLTTAVARYLRKHPKRKGQRGRRRKRRRNDPNETKGGEKQDVSNESIKKEGDDPEPIEVCTSDLPSSSDVGNMQNEDSSKATNKTETISSAKASAAYDDRQDNATCSKSNEGSVIGVSSVSYQMENLDNNTSSCSGSKNNQPDDVALSSSDGITDLNQSQGVLNNLINNISAFSSTTTTSQLLTTDIQSTSGDILVQPSKSSALQLLNKNLNFGTMALNGCEADDHIEIPILMIKSSFEARSRQYKCVLCDAVVDKISQYEDHWLGHVKRNELSATLVLQNDNQTASTELETVVSSGNADRTNNVEFSVLDKGMVNVSGTGITEIAGNVSFDFSQHNLQSEEVVDEGDCDGHSTSAKNSAAASLMLDKVGHKRPGDPIENGTTMKKRERPCAENETIDVDKLARMLNIDNVVSEEVVSSQEYNSDSSFSVRDDVMAAEESNEDNNESLNGDEKSDSESEVESDEENEIEKMNELISLASDLEDSLKQERSGSDDHTSGVQNSVRNKRSTMPLSYRIESETASEDSGNVFVCNHCQKSFKNFSSLKRHHDCIHVDINARGYECEFCGNKFSKQLHLHNHKLRQHAKTDDEIFQCDLCDKVFPRLANLRNHKRIHTDLRPHKCVICRACFKTKPTLKSHMLAVHKKMCNMPYKCPHCWWASDDLLNYKQHVAAHEGNKNPYDCDVCGKVFGTKANYRLHLRLHNEDYIINCEFCDKIFKQAGNYRRHVIGAHKIPNPEKPFVCDRCPRTFFSQSGLDGHYKWHTQDTNIACKECNAYFTNKNALENHTRIEHRGISFTCRQCGRVFAYEGKYKEHLERHRKAELTYDCDNCSRSFKSQGLLEFHLSRNECPKRKCRRCNLYVHNGWLEQHKACHLNIASAVDKYCQICGLHMLTVKDVYHHCLEHAGLEMKADQDLPESQQNSEDFTATRCQICGEKFQVLSALVDHIVNHEISEDNPVKCDVCSETFVVPEIYISHLGNCFEETQQGGNIEKENSDYNGMGPAVNDDDMGPATMVAMKDLPEVKQLETEDLVEDSKNDTEFADNNETNTDEEIEREFACVLCFHVFAKINGIKHHLLSACSAIISNKCWRCLETFDSNFDLREHWQTTLSKCTLGEVSMPLVECDQCDKKFQDVLSKDAHVTDFHMSGSYECSECSEKYPFEYLLKLHSRDVHKKKKARFCCLVCDKLCTKYSQLEAHMKSHQITIEDNNSKLSTKQPIQKKTENSGAFCVHCDRIFVTDQHLVNHQAVAHGIGESSIVCEICGRQFGTMCNLKVHVRTHTQEKPYKCAKCPRTFSQSSNMKRHLLTHGKELTTAKVK